MLYFEERSICECINKEKIIKQSKTNILFLNFKNFNIYIALIFFYKYFNINYVTAFCNFISYIFLPAPCVLANTGALGSPVPRLLKAVI